jgi:hypothetical protein
MGSPPAKELLPSPLDGRPLIDFSLDCARSAGAQPVIITRNDKQALIDAFRETGATQLVTLAASREWPDSPLQAEAHWGDLNIVLLPDTRFTPENICREMYQTLEEEADIVFAVFAPGALSTWGAVREEEGRFFVCEKPRDASCDSRTFAWGIFGFRREFGVPLLQAMLTSNADHGWKELQGRVRLLELHTFEDLTRGKE